MIFIIKLTLWIIAYTLGIARLSLAVMLLVKKRTAGDFWKLAFLISFAMCIISLSNMETVRQSGMNSSFFGLLATFSSACITITLPNYIVRATGRTRLYGITAVLSISAGALSIVLVVLRMILGNSQGPDVSFIVTIALMIAAISYSMILLGRITKPGIYGKAMAVFVFVMIPLMLYFDFFLVRNESFLVLPFMYLGINILMIWDEAGEFKEAADAAFLDAEKMAAAGLSLREQEVAALLVSGYTYQKIADELFISLQTVKSHATKIYAKAGAGNKMELLRKLGS